MFVVIFLVALVGGAGYVVNESRIGLNVQGISFYGKIALMLDVAGTFFMSAGWMFLVFTAAEGDMKQMKIYKS